MPGGDVADGAGTATSTPIPLCAVITHDTQVHTTNTPGDWDTVGGQDLGIDFRATTYSTAAIYSTAATEYCEGTVITPVCSADYAPKRWCADGGRVVQGACTDGAPPNESLQMSCQADGDGGCGTWHMARQSAAGVFVPG